jgi:hypothetical protein
MRETTTPKLDPQFIGQRVNARMEEQSEDIIFEAPKVKSVGWGVERSDKEGKDESRSSGRTWPNKEEATTVADACDRFR